MRKIIQTPVRALMIVFNYTKVTHNSKLLDRNEIFYNTYVIFSSSLKLRHMTILTFEE